MDSYAKSSIQIGSQTLLLSKRIMDNYESLFTFGSNQACSKDDFSISITELMLDAITEMKSYLSYTGLLIKSNIDEFER